MQTAATCSEGTAAHGTKATGGNERARHGPRAVVAKPRICCVCGFAAGRPRRRPGTMSRGQRENTQRLYRLDFPRSPRTNR